MSDYDNGYDEGYRAGMQKMREVSQARIKELEADLRKMALDLIAADGQSQEAYQAQLLAEAKLAKEEPFYIVLNHVEEQENGDATYSFDMSDKARDAILEEGLKLMLYCGTSKVDIQDVYDWILRQGESTEPHEKPETIWVDFNDEGAVVAGGKGPALYAGETTYVKASTQSKLPEGRHPLSDDWFREKTAAFRYED